MIMWGLVLDVVLVILLVATIIYAIVLNRRLAVLRTDRKDLEEFIQRLNGASQRAEAALSGIKVTAEQTQRVLNENGERAQALRDELIFLIERGDKVGERLAVSRSVIDETPAPPPAQTPEQSPGPASERAPERPPVGRAARSTRAADRDDAPRSQAEEDLLRALRDVR